MPRMTLINSCVLLALACAGCYGGAEAVAVQPRSLAGTEMDGELRTQQGAFVFDEQARLAFDYFLTADEELSAEALEAWVQAELTRRLPDAADEALAAWHAYAEYRAAAAAALTDDGALDVAEQRMAGLVDDHLGAYPIAAREQADITRAFALKRAAALPGEARERALVGLGEGTQDGEAFLVGRRAVELARFTRVSDGELQEVRARHFGAEAADRLAALDARRAAWQARLAAFTGEREALLAEFTGTAAQREAAIAELEARHFAASELRRVHALARTVGE